MPKTECMPLIRWGISSATINTGDGPMSYEDWCRSEIKRIGPHLKLVKHKQLCAVFVIGKNTKPSKPLPIYRQVTAQTIIENYYRTRNLAMERGLTLVRTSTQDV